MKKLLILIATVASLTSCGAYKRLAYLQDMVPNGIYAVAPQQETHISRGDRLAIQVLSSQPVLAAPFNISLEKIARDSSLYASDASANAPSYLVDSKGRINFPVLGPVYVEGLTLNELTTVLADEIRATNYLKDPVVLVEFANFNVIILGEIKSPGIISVPNGNMNMFELLAKTGDLTQDAQRDKIWVIRTEGGTRKVFTLNLKSKDVFDSPAFYLQQNDMVYIAPLDNKFDQRVTNILQIATTPLAFVSTIFSGWALVRSYTR